MKLKRTILAAAVLGALGAGGAIQTASAASLVTPGDYHMVINTTPTFTVSGAVYYKFGTDGAWNSSFTFGGATPSGTNGSNVMTDNNTSITTDGGPRGSSVGGDGYAGDLGISVGSSGSFSVSSVNVDGIPGTAGGTFMQYTDPSKGNGPDTVGVGSMTGTIDSSGNATFTPTGMLGAVSTYPSLYDELWNENPGATTYQSFTTASTTNGVNTINGAAFTSIGDVNGDGVTDYAGILVSGGEVGDDWIGFTPNPYFQVWNVDLLSAPVPIPAAAWLFGSGLLGLVGVARRRKSKGA